jgi:hypothetical protein
MVKSAALAEVEKAIPRLSEDERLWLIEQLAHALRQRSNGAPANFDTALAEMAADPEMQRELAEIAQEFAPSDMDGLEQP